MKYRPRWISRSYKSEFLLINMTVERVEKDVKWQQSKALFRRNCKMSPSLFPHQCGKQTWSQHCISGILFHITSVSHSLVCYMFILYWIKSHPCISMDMQANLGTVLLYPVWSFRESAWNTCWNLLGRSQRDAPGNPHSSSAFIWSESEYFKY